MLNFCSLYSGSSGNSLFVETENTKVLVDVGLSCKKIEEALSTIEKDPNSIDAILITHEHSDHIKGLSTISHKFDIPVFATRETFDAMPTQTEKISNKNINSDKFLYFSLSCIFDNKTKLKKKVSSSDSILFIFLSKLFFFKTHKLLY